MKDIGLVGVPYSGKSTLFTALTRTGAVGGRANQAVVPVPDARLAVLAELERSRKVVAAQVRFVDVPEEGLRQGLAQGGAPDWLVDHVVGVFRIIRQGGVEATTDAVHALTGREPRTFAQFARDHSALF